MRIQELINIKNIKLNCNHWSVITIIYINQSVWVLQLRLPSLDHLHLQWY